MEKLESFIKNFQSDKKVVLQKLTITILTIQNTALCFGFFVKRGRVYNILTIANFKLKFFGLQKTQLRAGTEF